jgi:hypothetical protein
MRRFHVVRRRRVLRGSSPYELCAFEKELCRLVIDVPIRTTDFICFKSQLERMIGHTMARSPGAAPWLRRSMDTGAITISQEYMVGDVFGHPSPLRPMFWVFTFRFGEGRAGSVAFEVLQYILRIWIRGFHWDECKQDYPAFGPIDLDPVEPVSELPVWHRRRAEANTRLHRLIDRVICSLQTGHYVGTPVVPSAPLLCNRVAGLIPSGTYERLMSFSNGMRIGPLLVYPDQGPMRVPLARLQTGEFLPFGEHVRDAGRTTYYWLPVEDGRLLIDDVHESSASSGSPRLRLRRTGLDVLGLCYSVLD